MIGLKVCCIQSHREVDLAVAAGATAVGLVGPMPSGPGTLDDATIARIAAAAPAAVQTVLLTSETDAAGVVAHVQRCAPRVVQLVDRVDPDVVPALRAACPSVAIWQVVHVGGPEAVANAATINGVDALLLDSGKPDAPVKTLGGTGDTHDWTFSAAIVAASSVPVWLAGGLTPENVGEAVHRVRPAGVDVCSGLRVGGALQPDRLARFVAAIRDVSHSMAR